MTANEARLLSTVRAQLEKEPRVKLHQWPMPPEEDSDDEITDALRMVLEKDPLLKGLKIGVSTDRRVVTLTGTVRTEQQRHAAEEDGWCLFGVDRVESRLEVRPPA